MGSSGAQRLGLGIVLLQAIACGPPAGWECTSEAGGLPCPNGTLCRGPSQLPSGHEETATVPRCYAVCESTFDCTSAAEACLKNSGESTGLCVRFNESCGDGVACPQGFICNVEERCNRLPNNTSCNNKAKDGLETDVDCGGPDCRKCSAGEDCSAPSDCQSGVCDGGVCQAPSCDPPDGVINGNETGLDCGGGSCPLCPAGQACLLSSDCESARCLDGTCAEATCSDGIQNQQEGGVDCGGPCPQRCPDHSSCNTHADCLSGVCAGTCQPPACDNNILDGQETDVDCGGPDCPPCSAGKSCGAEENDAYCATGVCGETLTGQAACDAGSSPPCCAKAICGDGVANGSDVCDGDDLGGETCISLGLGDGGVLKCQVGCQAFDTSACGPACPGTFIIDNIDTAGDLAALVDCPAVEALTIQNTTLTSLAGLEHITHISGDVSIQDNSQLSTLAGFDHIMAIGGVLRIKSNAALVGIEALNRLESTRRLYVELNPKLVSLSGLEGITQLEDGAITNNDSLPNLVGLSNLTGVENSFHIQNNAQLTSLDGLNKLSQVGTNLRITHLPLLESLSALTSLVEVGGRLQIEQNAALTTLSGLENLSSTGATWLRYNHSLTSISTLSGLTSTYEVSIKDNPLLKTLDGLQNLVSVGGDLTIANNTSLTSTEALSKVVSVGGWVWISNNDSLLTLTGLHHLESIGRCLRIEQNDALVDISALAGVVNGPTNPGAPGCQDSLRIEDNRDLPACAAASLANALGVTCTCSGNLGLGSCP